MGRITKPIEFYTSTNQVFGTFNLLDAFLNFHYDDRLMLKVGRFKPPFPFEFYGLSNQDLIAPSARSSRSTSAPVARSLSPRASEPLAARSPHIPHPLDGFAWFSRVLRTC